MILQGGMIHRVFLKWSQWSCKTTPFLPCQKQLCSQWLVSVHISLHANEHWGFGVLLKGLTSVMVLKVEESAIHSKIKMAW